MSGGVETRRQTAHSDPERPFLGPVVINGSAGWLGKALGARLASFSLEVRSVESPRDLSAASRDASSVVHLCDGVRSHGRSSPARTVLDGADGLADSVDGSAVERIVLISNVGAGPEARTDYLRATAAAETRLQHCGRDAVVFRCTHMFGPPDDPGDVVAALRADHRHRVLLVGSGRQRIAPVYREDVVDAMVSALDPRTYHGRFDLPGPEVMTLGGLARLVNRQDVRIRHLPTGAARLFGRTSHLRPELLDLLAMESVGEQTRADRAFGLERRRVVEVYRRDSAT